MPHKQILVTTLLKTWTCFQLEFWKTGQQADTMRFHTIKFDEPPACWRSGHAHAPRHHSNKHARAQHKQHHKRQQTVYRTHLFNLWPYTDISAHIRVLNSKYEGPPSQKVLFATPEGGKDRVQVYFRRACCVKVDQTYDISEGKCSSNSLRLQSRLHVP